jgi:nucleoside-diphosphate-sugar epimerase
MRILLFGYGYTAAALARRWTAQGWGIAATSRDPTRRAQMSSLGLEPVDPADGAALAAAARRSDAVLVTAPPQAQGCPGLAALGPALAQTGAFPDWLGYLSSTGVYGDRRGGWVNEDSPLKAQSAEGARRVAAERDWLQVGRGMGLTITVFRLGGIYGPGRSVLDRVRDGRARRLAFPGHVLSRIHIDDLASGLEASLRRPRPGGIYNLCDDAPAGISEVTAHAAALLGVEPPPEEHFPGDELPPTVRRFYSEQRRVSNARAKAELGWRPAYPSYREGLAAVLAAERPA